MISCSDLPKSRAFFGISTSSCPFSPPLSTLILTEPIRAISGVVVFTPAPSLNFSPTTRHSFRQSTRSPCYTPCALKELTGFNGSQRDRKFLGGNEDRHCIAKMTTGTTSVTRASLPISPPMIVLLRYLNAVNFYAPTTAPLESAGYAWPSLRRPLFARCSGVN
jgi:hypothetical protein